MTHSQFQSKPGEAANSVRYALNNGYRLIDTAACYFNEQDLGKVLDEEYIKPGKLKREDVFITTKVSTNYLFLFDSVLKLPMRASFFT